MFLSESLALLAAMAALMVPTRASSGPRATACPSTGPAPAPAFRAMSTGHDATGISGTQHSHEEGGTRIKVPQLSGVVMDAEAQTAEVLAAPLSQPHVSHCRHEPVARSRVARLSSIPQLSMLIGEVHAQRATDATEKHAFMTACACVQVHPCAALWRWARASAPEARPRRSAPRVSGSCRRSLTHGANAAPLAAIVPISWQPRRLNGARSSNDLATIR